MSTDNDASVASDYAAHQLMPLPDGWVSVKDEASGDYYFVNEKTDPPEITWDDPRLQLTTATAEAAAAAPPPITEATPTPAKSTGNPFIGTSMQTSGAPVPVLPVIAPPQATTAPTTTETPAPPIASYAPPPKVTPKPTPSDVQLQENGLPIGWLAVLDPPSGRFFFVDENKTPPVTTWDDPRTPEVETAPEGAPEVPVMPQKTYAPPPPKPAVAPAPAVAVAAAATVAAPPTFAPPPTTYSAPPTQQFAAPPTYSAPPISTTPQYAAPPTTYAAPPRVAPAAAPAPQYAAPPAYQQAPPQQVVYTTYTAPAAPPPIQPTYQQPPPQYYSPTPTPPPQQSSGPSVGQILVGGALLGAAIRRPGAALMVGAVAGSRRRY